MILEIADVMAVVKGIDIGGDSEGLIVDDTATPSIAVKLLPLVVVKPVDIVVANVVDSATKKVVRSLAAAVVVDDCVTVVGIVAVDPVIVVETIARIVFATAVAAAAVVVVVVVIFTGASVGM